MIRQMFFVHVGLRLTQVLKEPGYVVSTMVFPALFFLIFAHPNADTEAKARFLLASFSIFAVLGVCFFQFGVHYASEVRSGWHIFMRTLPVPEWIPLVAQWLSALSCGVLAALAVYVTVALSTDVAISARDWCGMVGVILLGAMPFAILSAAIARGVSGWAALPVFNLIYILSSFAGGLWLPPDALPEKVEAISRYLPTRHLAEIVWKVAFAQAVEWKYVWALAGFALFALCALAGSRSLARGGERI